MLFHELNEGRNFRSVGSAHFLELGMPILICFMLETGEIDLEDKRRMKSYLVSLSKNSCCFSYFPNYCYTGPIRNRLGCAAYFLESQS